MKNYSKQLSAVCALAGLTDLVRSSHRGKFVNVIDVSEHVGFSVSYLEQLFRVLRQAGFVTTARGPGGGYVSARLAEEVSVGAVMRAVEQAFHDIPTSNPFTYQKRLEIEIHRALDSVPVSRILTAKS